jgi:DNA-binding MarR family transcriptional regulator
MTTSRHPGHGEPSVRWLTPDEMQTWRALSLLLARLPEALGNQLQCDSDVSYLEYYVLALLSDQPDHTARMSQLAVLVNSELSRLSHLVSRLERRGFVRRAPDPADGRYTHAILTDAGRVHLGSAAPGHVARVRHLVFDSLPTAAQHALRDAARRIVGQIDADGC